MLVRKIYNTSLFGESLGAAALLQAPTSLLYNDKNFVRHRGDEFRGGRETFSCYRLSPLHYLSFQFSFQLADSIIREQFSFPTLNSTQWLCKRGSR